MGLKWGFFFQLAHFPKVRTTRLVQDGRQVQIKVVVAFLIIFGTKIIFHIIIPYISHIHTECGTYC